MKKLIALLLVVCMVAGIFVACKKPAEKNDPTTKPTESVATEATKAPEATEGTKAPEATEATGETEATETTGETEATEATGETEATEAPKETEATKGESKATAATKATKPIPTVASKPATKATQAATKATQPQGTTKPTTPPATTKPTTPPATTKPTTPVDSKMPYKGKTIEIYGMGDDSSYTDFTQYNEKYTWMMKAALMEWADLNGVKLVFAGSYDQNKILASMNAGDKIDVIFHTEKFPANANAGLLAPFTDDEYKKLADICGEGYLDLVKYKGKSHGFLFPWNGNAMLYYNKTMFEDYGVKTPKEYFMEDNWNWETLMEVMEAMTQDVDSDGKIDTYGMPNDSLTWCRMVNPYKTDDLGRLVNTIDDPMIKDFIQFKYDAYSVKKVVLSPGQNKIQTNVIYPMYAMMIGDAEPYNFEHMYQAIPNGNELEVVPVPAYEGRNMLQWTTSCVSLAPTCDERAAAVDMLAYLLKCGLKYMEDYSLGEVQTEYEGLKGTCQYSVDFLNVFTKYLNRRAKEIKKVAYDPELIDKIYKTFEGAEWYTYQTFDNVPLLTSYSEIISMPPESSIPAIKPKYQAAIDTYNKLYIG